MNEHFVLRSRDARIDLARQADFSLGRAEVRPSLCEVQLGGATERLEPKVMQVLVALTRAKGWVVSREDLAESCWGGRVVGEDAINRCISRLRRVFAPKGSGVTITTGFTPASAHVFIAMSANGSCPRRVMNDTGAPSRAAATAWLEPLPPGPKAKLVPKMVSPRRGGRAAR